MDKENKYAELTERMREIERAQDHLDAELDPDKHTWYNHFEIRSKYVSQQSIDMLKEIMGQ